MRTATITAIFSGCNKFPPTVVEPEHHVPNSVNWRKAILLNRSVVISAFGRAFPAHDFTTLRLISPNPADAYWTGESWTRAAQSYHADRKRGRA